MVIIAPPPYNDFRIGDPAINKPGLQILKNIGSYPQGGFSIKNYQVEDLSVCMGEVATDEDFKLTVQIDFSCYAIFFATDGKLTGSYNNLEVVLDKTRYLGMLINSPTVINLTLTGRAQIFAALLSGKAAAKLFNNEEKDRLKARVSRNCYLFIREVSEKMSGVLSALRNDTESEDLHQFLLTAKTLELIYLDVNQKDAEHQISKPATFRPDDLHKLENAKSIIADNLKSPYSLIELAHKVGLNDFKLKKGFREVYGTTVFGYLAELRMEEAKRMLIKGNITIAEVAHHIGYKNPHHFTAAFKKRYGCVPSKVV